LRAPVGAGPLGVSARPGVRLGTAALGEPERRLDLLRRPLVSVAAAAGRRALHRAAAADGRSVLDAAAPAPDGRVPAADAVLERALDRRLLALERHALGLGRRPLVGASAELRLGAAPLAAQPRRPLAR